MNFAFVQHESVIPFHRQAHHIQTMCRLRAWNIAMGRDSARNKTHFGQITLFQCFLRQAQMTIMDRIKRTAEDADGFNEHG